MTNWNTLPGIIRLSVKSPLLVTSVKNGNVIFSHLLYKKNQYLLKAYVWSKRIHCQNIGDKNGPLSQYTGGSPLKIKVAM